MSCTLDVTTYSVKERELISLPTRYGGLAIPIFYEIAEIEFINSSKITSELTTLIKKFTVPHNHK